MIEFLIYCIACVVIMAFIQARLTPDQPIQNMIWWVVLSPISLPLWIILYLIIVLMGLLSSDKEEFMRKIDDYNKSSRTK